MISSISACSDSLANESKKDHDYVNVTVMMTSQTKPAIIIPLMCATVQRVSAAVQPCLPSAVGQDLGSRVQQGRSRFYRYAQVNRSL